MINFFKVIILFYLLCGASLSKAQKSRNDAFYLDFKSRVKEVTVTEYSFELIDSVPDRKKMNRKVAYSFNDNGNITTQLTYNDLDLLDEKITYIHDYDGKPLQKKVFLVDDYGMVNFDTKTRFIYDRKRYLIEERMYKLNKEEEDSLVGKFIYSNDLKGNAIDIMEFDQDNKFIWRRTNQYDSLGNTTETKVFSEDSSLVEKTIWNYDSNENLIEYLKYQGDSLNIRFVFSYNSKNILIETKRTDNHVKKGTRNLYAYDTSGNMIRIGTLNAKGEEIKHTERTFDANGNATKVYIFYGSELNSILESTYSYY